MLFNSFPFIFFFFPTVLLVLYLTRGHQKIAYVWLVATSLFFYGWWNPANLPLILCSIGINYWLGYQLSKKHSRKLLTLGIAANVGALCYYKYANFFLDTVNDLFARSYVMLEIALPLAISFFTFQQIAYLVDAYNGEAKNYSFIQYLLFVTFFPQLIAGPIVHHQEMMQQFKGYGAKQLNWQNLATGLVIFTLGLMKKVMIADSLSPFVGQVFSAVEGGTVLTTFEAWAAALCYTFQLYFDFSGYSDMAIGAGLTMGIALPLNFNSPYKSGSIIEFWRRWHMTLSRFLKDYLYIPLGGKYHRYRNLFLTMLLGGLWHGAGWTFVCWGGLQGSYLVLNHFWKQQNRSLPFLFGWLITFLAVLISWVVFRAESMTSAISMMASMIGVNGIQLPSLMLSKLGGAVTVLSSIGLPLTSGDLVIPFGQWIETAFPNLLLASFIAFSMPNTAQITGYANLSVGSFARLLQWQPNLIWNLLIAIGLIYSIFELGNVSEFLYFQF